MPCEVQLVLLAMVVNSSARKGASTPWHLYSIWAACGEGVRSRLAMIPGVLAPYDGHAAHWQNQPR